MYTLKLHYNGQWVFEQEMNYVGGQIAYYDYCKGDIYNLIQEILDSKEVEIFVEHTDKDQWTYDVVNIEGARLQGEESLVDVDVIEESDATSEECESFHD
ncbi:hypothetical protein KY284_032968 [Solanum tuberosum]|nr:hypothetical protein KY284_032968 [Solanum tuberosum]